MRKRLALVLVMACACWSISTYAQSIAAAAADGDSFAYTGDKGPGFWAELHGKDGKEFTACAPSPSARQSPIDIDRVVEDPGLGPLKVDFVKAPFVMKNLGSTIQADPAFGSTLTVDGRSYSLLQFHFHTLSEHTVGGRHGVMELHLVFKHSDTDFAVIGVLYRVGRSNAFLKTLIEAGLPEKTTSPAVTVTPNLEKALTDASQYFTYPGSLTTPPCSPVVTWLVLKQWAELSPEQFEAFRRILGNDFRPLQDQNGRSIRATVRRWPFDETQPPTIP